MAHPEIWFDGNTHLVHVRKLTDVGAEIRGDPKYVNDGTMTVEKILDADGQDVLGGAVAGNYVSGSDGEYLAQLPHDTTLTVGETYSIVVRVVSGSLRLESELITVVKERRD